MPPTPTPAPARKPGLRPLLTRLHFYAGVLVAPFILVAALSGALYAVTPSLEPLIHGDQMRTDSRGPAAPLSEQIESARTAQPDLPLLALRPGVDEGVTTRVLFDDGRTDASRRLAVFVDPVTTEVQGELTAYGSSGSLPVRTWIDELHRGLHLGDVGRLYSELAASWLGVIVVVGLALWWTGPRRRRRLRPERTGSPRRRLLSWHGALGTWVGIGFLALSATGLTWSTYAGGNVTELRTALGWTTPTVATSTEAADSSSAADHGEHEEHGATTPEEEGIVDAEDSAASGATTDEPGIGFDGAARIAAENSIVGPVEIRGPADAAGTYVVQEIDAHWPTSVDAVSVSPETGEVVDTVRFEDYSLPAKLARWGVDGHMGLLFGVWNQIGLVALAGALITMIVLGYRMWWRRRPTRGPGSTRPGSPPPGGTFRDASPWQRVTVAVVALVLAIVMPVLGVSLLLFLLVDVLLAWRLRRREALSPGTHPAGPERVGSPGPGSGVDPG